MKKAFTLIELLVVITIIGLLSSMVLVGLSGVRAQGRDTRRIADLRNTQNALEIYFNINGEYPDSSNWEDLESVLKLENIGVNKLPRDPLASRAGTADGYMYAVPTTLLHYVLRAKLESENSQALNEDSDGTVHGLGCNDPFYCIEM